MTTQEIATALTGNTVHGMWGDTEYYSFFGGNGLTTYTTKRGVETGHWSAKNDQYCSVWAASGEGCYDLLADGAKVIWVVPSSGRRYESTLIPGKAKAGFE